MGIKETIHHVGDVLNPFDDIKEKLEQWLEIAELRIENRLLSKGKHITDLGIDAQIAENETKIAELKGKHPEVA